MILLNFFIYFLCIAFRLYIHGIHQHTFLFPSFSFISKHICIIITVDTRWTDQNYGLIIYINFNSIEYCGYTCVHPKIQCVGFSSLAQMITSHQQLSVTSCVCVRVCVCVLFHSMIQTFIHLFSHSLSLSLLDLNSKPNE